MSWKTLPRMDCPPQCPTESACVRLLQDQDDTAWACSMPDLVRKLLRIPGGIPADREDAAGETYLLLRRKIGSLKNPKAFLPWASKIFLRERKKLARARTDTPHFVHEPVDRKARPVDEIVDELARSRVARARFVHALRHVDDERQSIALLHIGERMTLPEVARVLRRPLRTVERVWEVLRPLLWRELGI